MISIRSSGLFEEWRCGVLREERRQDWGGWYRLLIFYFHRVRVLMQGIVLLFFLNRMIGQDDNLLGLQFGPWVWRSCFLGSGNSKLVET